MYTSVGTTDPASFDILAAARTAQAAKARGRGGNKRQEVDETMLADAIADFEATIAKILDRQRAIEERQAKLELETAATLSALLMARTRTI
jgi:hypothetical protein